MTFHVNDFTIVYGATQEEIEGQIKAMLEQGYVLQGTLVAQPNPHFNRGGNSQQPYLYYQMLARQKAASTPRKESQEEE